jgi:regulator of RNase E activity RraA
MVAKIEENDYGEYIHWQFDARRFACLSAGLGTGVHAVDVVFGSVAAGGVIGDNLAYYIMKTTGAGFVIDGAIRDLDGIAPLVDLAGYYRGATPPAIHSVMVTGIDIPVRIGNTTVMPGDVVFGDREGGGQVQVDRSL